MPDMQRVSIYGLFDPRTHELRYVGQTSKTLLMRLTGHLRTAAAGVQQSVAVWVRGLLDCGPRAFPEIDLLEETAQEKADKAEQFWIGYFRMVGSELLNVTNGGRGAPGMRHTAESRAKIGAGHRGKPLDPETRRRIAGAATGRRHSPETKGKIGAAHRGKSVGPTTRALISAINLGRRHTAETRAKVAAAGRGRKYSPEVRARRSEALLRYWASSRSAEARAHISVAKRAYWARWRAEAVA